MNDLRVPLSYSGRGRPRLWPFRLGFSALAIVSVATGSVVAALVLIALAIVYVGEAR